jgi:hypothetical protein
MFKNSIYTIDITHCISNVEVSEVTMFMIIKILMVKTKHAMLLNFSPSKTHNYTAC